MRRHLVGLPMAGILLVLLATGCASQRPGPATSDPATGTSPAASTLPSTPPPSPAPGSTAPSSAPAGTLVLSLRADGLAVLNPDGSTASTLLFDHASDDQVGLALEQTIGLTERTRLDECGQGPRVALGRDRFSALFAEGRFVGWSDAGGTTPRLSAVNGIAVGSTLATVREAQPAVQVTTDTLGPEFFSENGISGLLDGTAPTSKATLLYAGESCFFR
ncbi:MAG: hypothetical protein JNL54_00685 [Kineosporiaceae bacterium]|nr:hypothetical protein [Kineosporiaceae bacterium]